MNFTLSFLDHEIDDNKIADLEGKVNTVRCSWMTAHPGNFALKFSAPSLNKC